MCQISALHKLMIKFGK